MTWSMGKVNRKSAVFQRELLKRSYDPNWNFSDRLMAIDPNHNCALERPVVDGVVMSEPRTVAEVKNDMRERVGRRAPFLHADINEAEQALARMPNFDGETWAAAW